MSRLWLIRREDFFISGIAGVVKIIEAGSLWMTVLMTPEQRANYNYPIWNHDA